MAARGTPRAWRLCAAALTLLVAAAQAQTNATAEEEVDCSVLADAAACNATRDCFYIENGSNRTECGAPPCAEGCYERQVASYDDAAPAAATQPWCFKYYPMPLMMLLYFLNCFTIGFGFIGMWYNFHHHGRATKVDKKTRQRFRNRLNPMWQKMFIGWCLAFVVVGCLVVFFSMLYFIYPDVCAWVAMTIIYFILLGLCLIFFITLGVIRMTQAWRLEKLQAKLEEQKLLNVFDDAKMNEGREGYATATRYI